VKAIVRFPTFGWLLQLEWKPQDLWIGVYWKNTPERLDVWVCLLPCLPLHYASPVDESNAPGEGRGIPRTLDPIVGSSSEGTE